MTTNDLLSIHPPVLWITETAGFNTKDRIDHWIDRLPASRQNKVRRFKFIKDQSLSLVAGLLLMEGLKTFGMSNDNELIYNEYGKPYLKNSNLFFNLSHSEQMVMAIFADSEVGCDIEYISSADDAIADKCFCDNEKKLYDQSTKETKDNIFFRIWTIREAFIKAIGTGFSQPVPEFSAVSEDGLFNQICTFHGRQFIGQNFIYQNYACAWWMER